MLSELRDLFAACPAASSMDDYRSAVVRGNVLLKPTQDSREKGFAYLRGRYGLCPALTTFRALREFWDGDDEGRPLLTMLAASARDPILRASTPLVMSTPVGGVVEFGQIASEISGRFPDRFGPKTLTDTGRRVASSWEQSGHLQGRNRKIRRRAVCRPVDVAYALLLGHLCGIRGDMLFTTLWASLLDTPLHQMRDLAQEASRLGWIDLRSAGRVTEIGFRHLLGQREDGA